MSISGILNDVEFEGSNFTPAVTSAAEGGQISTRSQRSRDVATKGIIVVVVVSCCL